MAGICGIVQKNRKGDEARLNSAFDRMVSKLTLSPKQKVEKISNESVWVGAGLPLQSGNGQGIFRNDETSIFFAVEGLLFVNDSVKQLIQSENIDAQFSSNCDYIPYLYSKFGTDFSKKLTGWFNIFLFDEKIGKAILFNDRLGLLPLFLYNSGDQYLFASKLESILASGLMTKIDFDIVSIAEQFLFNYPLSKHSHIQNITTLPAASIIQLSNNELITTTYWSPAELIINNPIPKKEGFELINQAFETSVKRAIINYQGNIAVSLTGGWDGRLILSYALKNYSDRIHTFSFGDEHSPDIIIPQTIAKSEGFRYTPFLLDKSYIENDFFDSARSTIVQSNGVRGYRRAPYLYTMGKISNNSNLILSGNFGDEMLKFSAFKPSEVQSKALINYIQSDFTQRPVFPENLFNEQFLKEVDREELVDEWNKRFQDLEDEISCYDNRSMKYNHLKLTRIANRFFGFEMNSYNDFVYNFSPFLDFDFITEFSKTVYCGLYHPFNENRLKDKEMTSLLYAKLVKGNSATLAAYNTDRGFSMTDVTTLRGKFKVYTKKFISKGPAVKTSYLSERTADLFNQQHKIVYPNSFGKHLKYPYDKGIDLNLMSRIQSLEFWIGHITKEYL